MEVEEIKEDKIINLEYFENSDAFIKSKSSTEKTILLQLIAIALTTLHYSFKIFCYFYEIHYAKKNYNKYCEAYSLVEAEIGFFSKYIHGLKKIAVDHLINLLLALILLFSINFITSNLKMGKRKKLTRFLEILVVICINVQAYVLIGSQIRYGGIIEFGSVFIISFLVYIFFLKKFRISEMLLYVGFISTIFGLLIFSYVGFDFYIIEAFYPKLADKASPEVMAEVDILCQKCDVDINNCYVDSFYLTNNAYAERSYNFFSFVICEALLTKLTPQEVAAVFSHEIGHSKDPNSMFIPFPWVIQETINFILAFSIFTRKNKKQTKLFILSCLYFIFASNRFAFRLIRFYLSRKRECYADEYSKKMGYGADLASALCKMSKNSVINLINSGPFQLFFTHPSDVSRIANLKS